MILILKKHTEWRLLSVWEVLGLTDDFEVRDGASDLSWRFGDYK